MRLQWSMLEGFVVAVSTVFSSAGGHHHQLLLHCVFKLGHTEVIYDLDFVVLVELVEDDLSHLRKASTACGSHNNTSPETNRVLHKCIMQGPTSPSPVSSTRTSNSPAKAIATGLATAATTGSLNPPSTLSVSGQCKAARYTAYMDTWVVYLGKAQTPKREVMRLRP